MEGTIPSSSIAWIGILFSLIGGFLSILVTISLVYMSQLKKDFQKIQEIIDNKLSIIDYEKDAKAYDENLRASFRQTYERFGDRLEYIDRKFCGHSHTPNGNIIMGGS
jgi:hypothetical protein